MPEHDPHQSWTKTALLAALISMGVVSLTLGAVAMGWWIPGAFLGLGALVFVLVLLRNPRWWYRRMAGTSIGIAAALPSIPHFILKADIVDRASIELMAGGPGKSISALCLLLAGLFAFLDYRMHAPRNASSRTIHRASTGGMAASTSGTQSPTVGQGSVNYGVDTDRVIALAESKGVLAERLRTTEAENAELKKQLTNALSRVGEDADEGDEDSKQAISAARETGDLSKLQAVLVEHADQRGEEILDAASDYLELCREIAAVAYLRGDIEESFERLRIILRFEPNDLFAHNGLGVLFILRGDLEEAQKAFTHVRDNTSDIQWHSIAYGNLGWIEETRGNLDQAEEYLQRSLAISERLDSSAEVAAGYSHLGIIEAERGNLDAAETHHRHAIAIAERIEDQYMSADGYGNLGLIEQRRKNLDKSESLHKQALKINKGLGRQERMAVQYGNLGLIERSRGNLDAAEAYLKKALELNEHLQNLEGMAREYANLGLIENGRGNNSAARDYWCKSLELFERVGVKPKIELVQGWLDALPPE